MFVYKFYKTHRRGKSVNGGRRRIFYFILTVDYEAIISVHFCFIFSLFYFPYSFYTPDMQTLIFLYNLSTFISISCLVAVVSVILINYTFPQFVKVWLMHNND